MRARRLTALVLAAGLGLLGLGAAGPAHAQGDPRMAGYPGDTPVVHACFERWIAETNAKFAAFSGDASTAEGRNYNGRKPWFIHPAYGLIQGRPGAGPTSNGAPDEFHLPPFSNQRDRWMWWWWDTSTTATGDWTVYPYKAAGLSLIRPFILKCVADSTPATPATPGTAGGGTAGTAGTTPGTAGTTPPGSTPVPIGSDIPPGLTGFTIVAAKRVVREGALVTVPIWLVNTPDMSNINFEVSYDAGVARPEGDPAKGSFPPSALFAANAGEAGVVLVGLSQKTGASGTGQVALITFRAVGKVGQVTDLNLSVTKVDDPGGAPLTAARVPGWIKIVDENGLLPGDCNGDGHLDAIDALCALQMSVELRPVDNILDIDKDGQVTSRDASVILQRTKV